jgi:hypothetical protein
VEEFWKLIREDAGILEARFRKASIEGKGTSQEVADFREHALQDFVMRFFPFPHRVTKGKVRDTFGSISNSVDCVVCGPTHPYMVDSHGKFTLLLAEGVDAAIEVKPDLSQSAELERGLVQGLSVKQLRRAFRPTLAKGGWEYDRAERVPYVIFAMKCKSDPMDTGREILNFYRNRNVAPLLQADFVAVNGVGIFMNCSTSALCGWTTVDPVDAPRTGWFFEEWGQNSLLGFLWRMQSLAFSTIPMQESILNKYLFPAGGEIGVKSVRYLS